MIDMSDSKDSVKVAVIQAAPILFDKEKTVEKACDLIENVSKEGAELILFPEAFIPTYPRGLDFGAKVGINEKRVETYGRYITIIQSKFLDESPTDWQRSFMKKKCFLRWVLLRGSRRREAERYTAL